MSVHTSIFGSVRLTGKEAEVFEKQVKHGRSKKAAREALARGSVILDELTATGSAKVTVVRKATTKGR